MTGTRYEAAFYTRSSGVAGPTIVIIGGVHGNEPAGYLAARKIANWRCLSGTLAVMPDAHREAIRRKVRGYPANMNAMFPGKPDGSDMQRLAYEIWQEVIVASGPDLLLTLHESLDFHARDTHRHGQTLTYDFEGLTPLMDSARARVNADIEAPLHKFLDFCKAFPTCPTYQAYSQLGTPATSIETSRTLALDTRIRYQLMMVMGFLDEFGMDYEQRDVPYLSTRNTSPARDSGTEEGHQARQASGSPKSRPVASQPLRPAESKTTSAPGPKPRITPQAGRSTASAPPAQSARGTPTPSNALPGTVTPGNALPAAAHPPSSLAPRDQQFTNPGMRSAATVSPGQWVLLLALALLVGTVTYVVVVRVISR